MPRKVLVVEDQEILREGIVEALREAGFDARGANGLEEALRLFQVEGADAVVTDLRMEEPDSGLKLLERIKGAQPLTEVLLVTAYATVEHAVAAMKAGAADFLVKPVNLGHLVEKVRAVLRIRADREALEKERERSSYLQQEIDERFNDGEIIGRSAKMQDLYARITKVAQTPSSVLVTGESGTGKELVARAIHRLSDRSSCPFIRVSCGALAEGVLESELFGHERGAFTGAMRQRRGRFELADTGTLFLDEIAETTGSTQVKLLRVLQEKSFERVGGERTIQVDVRLIAATNRNLRDAVAGGSFREDLFYRLHVIPIELPPLRDRREDIPLLCDHFLDRLSRRMNRDRPIIRDEALKLLVLYDWPGNVRELENVLERAFVLCEGGEIRVEDLPFAPRDVGAPGWFPPGVVPLRQAVQLLEKELIRRALEEARGVKQEAARRLRLKPSVLYYKLEKYGLASQSEMPEDRAPGGDARS
ncbi:MAG: sigma-54-dependent Fis family transcriptional regulator [Candidatus Eisenbacteria bacterium]|nr:sigma-54-dependent Fis family transcriptional regulator [Candidatus Eisenbacteria bacterium]